MPKLHVLQGPDHGRAFSFSTRRIVGRRCEDIELNDHTVSRRHAALEPEGPAWRISDLGSSNGTYVNGERIGEGFVLHDGDQIKIGGTVLVFFLQSAPSDLPDADHRPARLIQVTDGAIDSAILSAIDASEESVILAAPETADAVHAWNVMCRIAEAAGGLHSAEDFLETVVDIILEHLVVDRACILIRTSTDDTMRPVVVRYRNRRERKDAPLPTSSTIINHVVSTRSGVLCSNAPRDERFAGGPPATDARADSLGGLALRSVICVPVIGQEEIHGVIHLDCPVSKNTFTSEHLRLATAIGRVVGLALENQRSLEARMRSERLAATGETVAYLSHHIRNILQGMRSGADIVELGVERENLETIRSGWQTVEHNLDRILHLTTNMLTFSKDRVPCIEYVRLNEIVEDAVDLARRQAELRGVMVLMTLDDLPPVPLDREGIHQAIFNLIANGVAASPADQGKVSVKTRFDAAKNRVAISITDNGPGIPADKLSRIFQPFHSSKGQGGTGLGLAAAKKLVDELDGEIVVTTKEGRGTRFVIYLAAERTTMNLVSPKPPLAE